jgi:lysozyme
MSKFKGIDVSHWQGDIDWFAVKGDGVQFAFIKATQGTKTIDDKMEDNIKGATKYKIPVGAYHFAEFDTVAEAHQEAKFFLDAVKEFDFNYPLVLDLEINKSHVSKSQLTDSAIAFLEDVEKAGHFVLLYTSKYFMEQNLDAVKLKPYALWIARYGDELGMTADVWQYSSSGKVNGIKGYVDMNISYRDFALEIQLMEERRKPKEKIVTYTVKSNDNLASIAMTYNTSVNKILKLNPAIDNKNVIYPKQKIKVPDNRK